jgi:enoyl-CoA hydratase
MNFDDLKTLRVVRADGAVTEVILADPRPGNPLGADFWRELPAVFEALGGDDATRAIVLRAEGPHFTFGLDLVGLAPELNRVLDGTINGRESIGSFGQRLQRAIAVVADCPKAVVAAVQGWCIGGGIELLSGCDLRLCATSTRFSLREVRMGMVPDLGGIQRLPFIIGEGALRELALEGADMTAEWALRVGLVNEIHSDAAAVSAAAHQHARRIAANPPRVIAGIKQVLNQRIEYSVMTTLRHALNLNSSLMQTEDFREALSAFAERRPAKFSGR